MFKLIVASLFLCAQVLARPQEEVNPLVVGGKPVPEDKFAYAVSLRFKLNKEAFCGGGLLSPKFVLSAAHCGFNARDVLVGFGSVKLTEQELYEVAQFFKNPGWKPPSVNNDIALYKLKNPVKVSPDFVFLSFPFPGNEDNKDVTALGWGRTAENGPTSNHLLHLKKKTLDNKTCLRKGQYHPSQITAGHLCLDSSVNQGMCFGDSGSPLVLEEDGKPYVVGVVSWGVPCAVGSPDVFTRVSHYAKWLKDTMGPRE